MNPICIGLLDRPELQSREPLTVHLTASLLMIGAPGSGKTTAIATMLHALSLLPSSERAPFEVMLLTTRPPEWGGGPQFNFGVTVIDINDDELTERALRRAAGLELPPAAVQILLIIDGWSALLQRDEELRRGSGLELIARLLQTPPDPPVGIVVTATHRAAIPYRFATQFEQQILFRLNDADDYGGTEVPGWKAPSAPSPGWCLVRGHVGQIAVAPRNSHESAPPHPKPSIRHPREPVANLPARVSIPTAAPDIRDEILFALSSHHQQPRYVPQMNSLIVSGPSRSGRSTALHTIATQLAEDRSARMLLCPRDTPLRHQQGWDSVAIGDDAALDLLQQIASVLERNTPIKPLHLFVDDYTDFVHDQLDDALARFLRWSASMPITVRVAANHQQLRQRYGEFISRMRATRSGVLLMPNVEDGDYFDVTLPRRTLTPTGPGRGYLLRDGIAEEVLIFDSLSRSAPAPGL